MAISIQIYSNANSSSKTVSFDFVGEILAANRPDFNPSPANSASTEYFFKITTNARQDNNVAYPIKIVRSLSEFPLNPASATQKQSVTDTNVAYSNVKSMVIDYVWDYIHGHAADKYSSGCIVQLPMKFS